MSTVVTLTHFQHGKVDVIPVINEGRREWVRLGRPMMRPWPHCFFNEPPHELDALHVANSNPFEGVGHNADRLSA